MGISYFFVVNRESEWRYSYIEFYRFIVPVFGYKIVSKHFFFRAHYTPFFTENPLNYPLGGLSLGYAF